MNSAESAIFAIFRSYRTRPNEMLFFNPGACAAPNDQFDAAMLSLRRRGLVIKERPSRAYSLTSEGFRHAQRAHQLK